MDKEGMKTTTEEEVAMELPESKDPADIFWSLVYDTGKPQVLKHAIIQGIQLPLRVDFGRSSRQKA